LSGFRLGNTSGDAVIVESIDGLMPLDHPPITRAVKLQIFDIIKKLGQAKLGHSHLSAAAFGIDSSGRVVLLDGEHLKYKGLHLNDVLQLEYAGQRFITKADRVRAWRTFGFGAEMPKANRIAKRYWRTEVRDAARGDNEFFGSLSASGWTGRFTKRSESSVAWADASRSIFTAADWTAAWPALLAAVMNDQLEIIKRGDNGDVLRGDVILNGRPFPVVIKRPKRKSIRQAIVDVMRPSRARRTWIKTWKMLVRDVPCEWPMLIMEKRTLGYVADSILVFGRIDGPTLAEIDLDQMTASERESLFRRAGRTLRQIESLGFTHMDAKSTNWIVFNRSTPVLVDVDGVRHYRWAGTGIARLLRAMKHHAQYTPADSLALCQGYSPTSPSRADT
ncbi:MAG: hypothetical protein JO353_09655, partial [Phycisphaerae bacterium]|nr:hypothetical protein [Phycisphaerae bacterium]